MKPFRLFLALALFAGGSLLMFAQSRSMPSEGSDETGFEPIFDGMTLDGWKGDTNYWRVENGCIVGEVTPTNLLKVNSFLVWHGSTNRDFELKVEYRVSDKGNSGINYRSVMATNGPWAMRGYQADIDGANKYNGQNYEERGRQFLALRGQVTRVIEGKAQVIGALGTVNNGTNELDFVFKTNDWNEYHVIASGNVMTHILNGRVTSVVIDEDAKNRRANGLIGVQVHVGPPMKIEYRNFRLKNLDAKKE